jgi:hypothetical protein
MGSSSRRLLALSVNVPALAAAHERNRISAIRACIRPNKSKISYRRSGARRLPVGLRARSSRRDARRRLAAWNGYTRRLPSGRFCCKRCFKRCVTASIIIMPCSVITPNVTRSAAKSFRVLLITGSNGATAKMHIGMPKRSWCNNGGLFGPGRATFRMIMPKKNAANGPSIRSKF